MVGLPCSRAFHLDSPDWKSPSFLSGDVFTLNCSIKSFSRSIKGRNLCDSRRYF
jgi:hypothetical protein